MAPSIDDITRFSFTFDDIGKKLEPFFLVSIGEIGVCDPTYFSEGYGNKKTHELRNKKGKYLHARLSLLNPNALNKRVFV